MRVAWGNCFHGRHYRQDKLPSLRRLPGVPAAARRLTSAPPCGKRRPFFGMVPLVEQLHRLRDRRETAVRVEHFPGAYRRLGAGKPSARDATSNNPHGRAVEALAYGLIFLDTGTKSSAIRSTAARDREVEPLSTSRCACLGSASEETAEATAARNGKRYRISTTDCAPLSGPHLLTVRPARTLRSSRSGRRSAFEEPIGDVRRRSHTDLNRNKASAARRRHRAGAQLRRTSSTAVRADKRGAPS